MARLKRPVFLFFFSQNYPFPDIELLLRGVVEPSSVQRIYALSAAHGEPVAVTQAEVQLLLTLPSDRWTEPPAKAVAALEQLVQRGLVLREGGGPENAERRRRDEVLEETGWSPYAALFHFLTRWHDIDLRAPALGAEPLAELPQLSREDLERFVAERGAPPPAFHSLDRADVTELPLVERDDGLFALLSRRKTTRSFDSTRPLSLEQLSLVLRWVFGAHGHAEALDDVVTVKRTSPSGGGLHPIEAYPLVADVESLQPGLYHYRARDHALELIEALASAGEAHELGTELMSGQNYFGSAHVMFILASRFERNHWKYRSHDKAYPAMLMDAAHLSQTLYLVAAELGLGAFITAAVNGANAEERLGLDGYREGVLALLGCGLPAAKPSPFDPSFSPYVPRETRLP